MNVQDASGQAPLHAGSDNTSEPSEVGANSTERLGSVLDMNEPPNLDMVEQSAGSKPLSDDEQNTALKGAGITHQADADGKETFEEIYFERYPRLYGPGDPKYEEALIGGNHGQFVPEEDDDIRQLQVPVVLDQRTPSSRVTARKNLFEKRLF